MGIFNYLTQRDSVKIRELFKLMHGVTQHTNEKYQDLLSILALGLRCLLVKEPLKVWSRVVKTFEAGLRKAVFRPPLSQTEEIFLTIVFATVIDLTELGYQIETAPLSNVRDQAAEVELQLKAERDRRRRLSIALLKALMTFLFRIMETSQSNVISQLKPFLQFRLGTLMMPNEYWKDSDHFLTENIPLRFNADVERPIKLKQLSLAVKMHWARSDAKDWRSLLQVLKSVLSLCEQDSLACTMNDSMLNGMTSTRSSYLSSAFGRSGPTSFSSRITAHGPCTCRKSIESLQYVWSIFLPVLETLSRPPQSRTVPNGGEPEKHLLDEFERSEAPRLIQRLHQLIKQSSLHGGSLSYYVPSGQIHRTLIKIFCNLGSYSKAQLLLWDLFECNDVLTLVISKFTDAQDGSDCSPQLLKYFLGTNKPLMKIKARNEGFGRQSWLEVAQPFWNTDIPSMVTITDVVLPSGSENEAMIEVDPLPRATEDILLEGEKKEVLRSTGLEANTLTYLDLPNFRDFVLLFIECCPNLQAITAETAVILRNKTHLTEHMSFSITKIQGRLEVLYCLATTTKMLPEVATQIGRSR